MCNEQLMQLAQVLKLPFCLFFKTIYFKYYYVCIHNHLFIIIYVFVVYTDYMRWNALIGQG